MMERKMIKLLRSLCRMQDEKLIKQVVFGAMDGKKRKKRPKREWTDDLVN